MMTWLKGGRQSQTLASNPSKRLFGVSMPTVSKKIHMNKNTGYTSQVDNVVGSQHDDETLDQFPINDSYDMETIFLKDDHLGPTIDLYNNNPSMTAERRCRIVNWLLEMAIHYNMHNETFFLAIYYFDRFLTIRKDVDKSVLQLVAVASLMIAAKIEEIYPPQLADYAEACENRYRVQDIAEAELEVLKALDWKLSYPSLYRWLGIFSERTLNPLSDGLVYEFAVKLLHLSIHHPTAALHDYKSLAATSLAVILGVPRVEHCTMRQIDLKLLDWMMSFLSSPSASRLADQHHLGVRRKKLVEGKPLVKSTVSDLDFLLSLIIV